MARALHSYVPDARVMASWANIRRRSLHAEIIQKQILAHKAKGGFLLLSGDVEVITANKSCLASCIFGLRNAVLEIKENKSESSIGMIRFYL